MPGCQYNCNFGVLGPNQATLADLPRLSISQTVVLIVKLQELYAEHHPEGTDAAEPEPEPEPVRLLQTKNIPTDSPRPSASPPHTPPHAPPPRRAL